MATNLCQRKTFPAVLCEESVSYTMSVEYLTICHQQGQRCQNSKSIYNIKTEAVVIKYQYNKTLALAVIQMDQRS